ncbi:MAG: hypothetical protein HY290_12395 [Planctomycetia bacterium]|nr:hypothetical protein [Planctomycetia bacterium]
MKPVLFHKRALAGLLAAVAFGVPAVSWWSGREGLTPAGVGAVVAAEPGPVDPAVAAPKDVSAPQSVNPRPAGATHDEAPQIEFFPRPSKTESRIFEALDKPTTVDFADTSLVFCLAYLQDYHKFSVLIDRRALDDAGVKLDQPITLRAAGITLRSILKLLLEPVQLLYVVENDLLKITTVSSYSKRLITRIYPVRDLSSNQVVAREGTKDAPVTERPGDLETAITKTIDPDSWDDKAGPASITFVTASGSLVIRQTPPAHEKILRLLRDLREARRIGQRVPDKKVAPTTSWRFRGPRRAEAYSLVGILDLDGDGKGDRDLILDMIAASTGKVDNEIDEQGVLRVDGQVEDRPSFSDRTKFIVLGKIPQPADLSDADQIATSLKIAEHYMLLEAQARERGVRTIGLEEFVRFIGFERVTAPGPDTPPRD